MNPWNSWTTRIAAAPLGFVAGAVLALVWTGGHHAQKRRCHPPVSAAHASVGGYHARPAEGPVLRRAVVVPVGQALTIHVEGGLKSVVHDAALAEVAEVTPLVDGSLRIEGQAAGEGSLSVWRPDGGKTVYRVEVLGEDYRPYQPPCGKRSLWVH
ncbi:MAG: pilus assembly protein N-terminal domain-containing protein [Deltaproteobacteria bacterium]|nr:pilus assembly protein N-terminal domain-containing protein [Deltaproteobacteria bacterium]